MRTLINGVIAPVLRAANHIDLPLLARMNHQLIEDEASRNHMTLAELEARMLGFLEAGWQVVLIENDAEIVGYALFQSRPDEYEPDRSEVYVRQFFIDREHRMQGIGRRAYQALVADWFPADATIVLDVLEANSAARRFWESLGLKAYCTTLRSVTG